MKILWFVLRIGVGALFAYAGFSKLILPIENFEGILSQYEVIAHCLIHPIAFLLPWIEWMGGSLLILGFAPRLTSGILATVVFLFLMVLTSTLIIGGDANLNCGCFGEKIHLSIQQVVLLDGLNFFILLRLFSLKNFLWSLDGWLKK